MHIKSILPGAFKTFLFLTFFLLTFFSSIYPLFSAAPFKSPAPFKEEHDCVIFINTVLCNTEKAESGLFNFIKDNISAVTENRYKNPKLIITQDSSVFDIVFNDSHNPEMQINNKNLPDFKEDMAVFIRLNSFQIFSEHSHKSEEDYSIITKGLFNIEYAVMRKKNLKALLKKTRFNNKPRYGQFRRRDSSVLSEDVFKEKIIGLAGIRILNLINDK